MNNESTSPNEPNGNLHNESIADDIFQHDIFQSEENSDSKGDEAIATLKDLMSKMQAEGIYGRINMTFSGAGDSGEIEGPNDLSDAIRDYLEKHHCVFDIEHSYYTNEDGNYVKKEYNPRSIFITSLLYDILEKIEPGWEINEGSSGYIDLNFDEKGKQDVAVNVRVVTYVENSYKF